VNKNLLLFGYTFNKHYRRALTIGGGRDFSSDDVGLYTVSQKNWATFYGL